ncbi:MAG: hypothetical protein E7615_03620 [Ruminococcaceae bacterium]|nr:hypothetical protein [Oscillospiraceae bacterium]
MDDGKFLKIYSPELGQKYAPFSIYLPAGNGLYTGYRFYYMKKGINTELLFSGGPNDPSNCEFYRIREAYMGKLENGVFMPHFRVLQGGEVGFAFCEKGAGDFCGGFHGDEVMTEVALIADGKRMELDRPYFGSFEDISFEEGSVITRCNTPTEKLVFHKQKYTVKNNELCLMQYIEWLNDAMPLVAAYTPMLTAQRLNPSDKSILTDTVEFYDVRGGKLLTSFDTTSYGDRLDGKFSESFCRDTKSTCVKVYGKKSGVSIEGGYNVIDDTIPDEQIDTHLCVRFGQAFDNKIYFNIAKGQAPKKGTVWQSDIFYRLTYSGKGKE